MKEVEPISGLIDKLDLDYPKNKTEHAISNECQRIARLLIEKNRAYGNSFEKPLSIFSKSSAEEQIFTRIDDKLNRIKSGSEYPGDDTILDLAGYLILLLVLKETKNNQ